jgi:USP6 N-terminal-like protein
MGPITATLLCYFDPERTYAALVRLHDAAPYNLHAIFSPGFPGLLEAIYVQERVMEMMMPDVYKAFKAHMVTTTSYATKWYITLFANTVPFQTQLRIWDAFFLEGQDVFVTVALAIVWAYKGELSTFDVE